MKCACAILSSVACTALQYFSEYDDDIYPYATFQAWQPVGQVSSQRGFQTFVYQGSDLHGVNCYAPGEVSDKSTVTLVFLTHPCFY
jgi:hypothetical protein